MKIKVFQGFSNTYIVYNHGEGVIVDPGNPFDNIVDQVENLKVNAIIITHGHFDHYLYLDDYKERLEAPVYMNFKDKYLVDNAPKWVKEFFGISIDYVPELDYDLTEGMSIVIGGLSLKIIETPGHSPGSISIVGPDFLITGDLVFEDGGIGRTDLLGGNERELVNSIKRVMQFPDDYMIYPGHGNPFKVKDLKKWIPV